MLKQNNIVLRDYQQECIDAIVKAGAGRHLVVMATGLGKTVTFAAIPRTGRTLILSHRDELVRQPEKYFNCSFGVEKASEYSNGEDVVSASVQTLRRDRRLHEFKEGDFDTIITDEAHHAKARSYKKIVDYFKPRVHLGFTATPNRADGKGLKDVFDDIIFNRDLMWGINNGYLTDIDCRRVEIGWSTQNLKISQGDFQQTELDAVVNTGKNNEAIADVYRTYRRGQTLIFATSVDHAHKLQKLIPNSQVIDGKTSFKARQQAIQDFTNRKIDCLINFGVFTEGTDLPLIETLILARPTTNQSLYQQMVGRGLRLHQDKESLLLIDCVGNAEKRKLCTAPSLLGIKEGEFDEQTALVRNGKITGLKQRMFDADNNPYGYVLRERKLNLLASNLGIAWMPMPGGGRRISIKGIECTISAPNLRGECEATILIKANNDLHRTVCCSVAEADDILYKWLNTNSKTVQEKNLWDANIARSWGKKPASGKQLNLLAKLLTKSEWEKFNGKPLTKREAAVAIDAALEFKNKRNNLRSYNTTPKTQPNKKNYNNSKPTDQKQTIEQKQSIDQKHTVSQNKTVRPRRKNSVHSRYGPYATKTKPRVQKRKGWYQKPSINNNH